MPHLTLSLESVSLAGPTIDKLIEHAGPNRYPKLASIDKSCGAWRRDDATDTAAFAGRRMAVAVDDTAVGLDLNLQYLRIFGTRKLF